MIKNSYDWQLLIMTFVFFTLSKKPVLLCSVIHSIILRIRLISNTHVHILYQIKMLFKDNRLVRNLIETIKPKGIIQGIQNNLSNTKLSLFRY